MKVKVTNPTGRPIGGMVNNMRWDIKPGVTEYDVPIEFMKEVVKVLNTENGVELEVK